ncbi:S-layer homology domain-containing protein [uncultured Intestinimonas sp.]|uniref:S-layer homology domain-containing protein n=1 Tax=uncultured Intestinimonas sp. TaxID=1689265 RepID=UPI0025EEC9C0|nr:S-layer homology domain-containing protein [uncultured Intestinimonas sp.]
MPRRTSFLSILLALAMAAAALTPWASAVSGGLSLVTSGQEATSQAVGFTGVPEDCQSLQVTFTLSQSSPSYDFALDGSLAALPGVHATHRQEGDRVTVYVTLRTGTLTDNGSLTLGTLSTPGASFSVTGFSNSKLLGSNSGELDAGPSDSGNSGGGASDGTGSGSGGQTSGGSGSQTSGGSGSDGEALWSIQVDRPTGGTLTASRSQAASGRTVTLTAVPDQGYVLQKVTAVTAAGKSLSLSKQKDGTYTFTMPAAKVTVSAAFTPKSQTEGEGPLPFTDVASGDWYAQAVAYVYRQGLMSGTALNQFSPDLTTNRAMLVTILYRLAGSPAVSGAAAFTDVSGGDWFASGVAWASANGIVTGYGDGRFGPSDPITREQMAAILYRYAGFAGQSTAGQADLSGYTDAGLVSAYAAAPMGWAVDRGLITGVSAHTLVPRGSATRAQVATILMRFCQMAQN